MKLEECISAAPMNWMGAEQGGSRFSLEKWLRDLVMYGNGESFPFPLHGRPLNCSHCWNYWSSIEKEKKMAFT